VPIKLILDIAFAKKKITLIQITIAYLPPLQGYNRWGEQPRLKKPGLSFQGPSGRHAHTPTRRERRECRNAVSLSLTGLNVFLWPTQAWAMFSWPFLLRPAVASLWRGLWSCGRAVARRAKVASWLPTSPICPQKFHRKFGLRRTRRRTGRAVAGALVPGDVGDVSAL